MANVQVSAPPPMVTVLTNTSGNSRPVPVPPDLKAIPRDDAPAYDDLINFPRARDKELAQCVMCGRRPGGSVVIPRQNKDVCKDCDRQIWQHVKALVFFKWCKGCKRFLNLARFGDRIGAAKCEKCRHRARQSYMAKKTKAGLKGEVEFGVKEAAAAANQPGFIPAKAKAATARPNPFEGQPFNLVSNPGAVALGGGQGNGALRASRPPPGPVPTFASPSNPPVASAGNGHLLAGPMVAGPLSQLHQHTGGNAATTRPSATGGVGSILKMEMTEGGDGLASTAGRPEGELPSSFTDPSWGRALLGRTPRSFTAGSYEVQNMKRHRIGSISRRLRSASDLEDTGVINRKQKGVLKDLLISGDPELQTALDKFDNGETSALEAIITSGTLDYPPSMDILDGFDVDFDGLFPSGEPEVVRDEWPQAPLDGVKGRISLDEYAEQGGLFTMDDVEMGEKRLAAPPPRNLSIGSFINEDPLAALAGIARGVGDRKGSFASITDRKNSFAGLSGSLGLGAGFMQASAGGGAESFGGVGLSLGASFSGEEAAALMKPEEAAML